MFNLNNSSSVKGSAYIILNVIRSLNILVLLLIAASTVILMIPAKMPDGFTFFNDIALFFILVICIFLAVSELPSFKMIAFIREWYARNWPAVGHQRGLKWFGLAMVILGCHTLGRLSDPRNDIKHMTLPFWRLCLAGGVLAITFGFVNILTSWLYSSKGGMTVRELRSTGAVTETATYRSGKPQSYDTLSEDYDYESHRVASVRKEKGRSWWNKGSKKPKISRPIAHQPDLEKGVEVIDDPVPSRSSPVIPGLQRPPSALHPIHGRQPSHSNHARQPSNRYSLASNFDQFSQV